MPSKKTKTPIEPGFTYHIYNRGNNYQEVFFTNQDYQFFLDKFKFYLAAYCNVYAYALLPNHYHFLLRVNDDIPHLSFSKQFSKCILSYTNAINNRVKRNGSLFMTYFRRIKVNDEKYLKYLLCYIHTNPSKHKIIDDFRTWKYSSYQAMISEKPSSVDRATVLNWFDGKDNFIAVHHAKFDEDQIKGLIMEE